MLTDMGSAWAELSNFTAAIAFYKRALSVDPHHVGALLGIGDILERLGNRSAALPYYKEAAASVPWPPSSLTKEPSWLLSERADAFINLGNYSQALNIVNQILNATDLDGLEVKGEALLNQNNDVAALTIFNKLLQRHIAEAWLLDDKGTALSDLGNNYAQVTEYRNTKENTRFAKIRPI
jgi:tetratricopeptide (TPR) repeat protein